MERELPVDGIPARNMTGVPKPNNNTLFLSPHGSGKETPNDVIFQIRFTKQLGKGLIENMRHDEQEQQLAFAKTSLRTPNGSNKGDRF